MSADSGASRLRRPRDGGAEPDRAGAPERPPASRVPASARWLERRAARERRGLLARARDPRLWVGLLLVTATAAIAGPYGMVALGTRRSRECLERYLTPRGAARPDCRREMRWFVAPSRLPFTAARYRAEELNARAAMADYEDAAVGTPDRAALERAADELRLAQQLIRKGSQRLELDELGAAVGSPHLGRAAASAGDRKTLVERGGEWLDWPVRLQAIEAALLDGDLSAAQGLAKRYAEWDPRDADLRTSIAALLCVGGDAKRGIELLTLVQNDRAARRHANMVRGWGEVRAAILACSARLGSAPPPKPVAEAGEADAVEARAVLRVRLAHETPEAEREAQLGAIAMLKSAPRTAAGRRGLLAAVLASSYELDAAEAAELAHAREDMGESPLVPSSAIMAEDLVFQPVASLRPVVAPATFQKAAERLLALAGGAATEGENGRIPAETARTLRAAAGALMIEAGVGLARAGDGEAAARAVDQGASLALFDAGARALARSSVLLVALEPARALAELESATPSAEADPAASPAERLERAAWLVQRAQILATLGRRAEAAAAAALAEEAASRTGDGLVITRARWTRLALEDRPAAPPPEAIAAPDAPLADGSDRPWPWAGYADTGAPWAREPGDRTAERAIEGWRAALAAGPEMRRAFRHAARRRRGDAPVHAFVPYLAAAAELVRDGGDPEVWLDALGAIDARRVTIRAYAWARAQAARWRGDVARAERWEAAYRTIGKVAADPASAELAAILRL